MARKEWVRAGLAILVCTMGACDGEEGEGADVELGSCVSTGGETCEDDVAEEDCDGSAGESWATPLTCADRGF